MKQWYQYEHSIGINNRANLPVQHGTHFLCSLLAVNSQINVLLGQKMQLTGCDYGDDIRNMLCVERNEWPYVHSVYYDAREKYLVISIYGKH